MNELRELCEALIEQRLTDEQHARLQALLRGDAEARRFYLRYLHLHAALQWSGVGLASGGCEPSVETHKQGAHAPRSPWVWRAALLALAASLAVASWVALRPSAVATLDSAKSCKWDEGTLPTQVGAALTAGRLRLVEGLAKLVFRSGAEVTIEAPADLELVSRSHCVLHAGRLVAKVPPSAIGFIVDTPAAKLEDLGTEFAVHVRDGERADVNVFNGVVDARHLASGKKQRLLTGASLRFDADGVSPFDPLSERPPSAGHADGALHVSTAVGRGKDGYVEPVFNAKHRSDILLLVKNASGKGADYIRKAYVGLDLAPLAGRRVADAELTFTFTPTGMGFAAEVPDATFTVYGLTDESLDGWDEKGLMWGNAPANGKNNELDVGKVTRLGAFRIAQGEMHGTRSVKGEALAAFLNRDTNKMATFVLVRETPGSGRSCMVHGFAGKNHPTLPPPTLKVSFAGG
jgi:hypothetical protein